LTEPVFFSRASSEAGAAGAAEDWDRPRTESRRRREEKERRTRRKTGEFVIRILVDDPPSDIRGVSFLDYCTGNTVIPTPREIRKKERKKEIPPRRPLLPGTFIQ
jgi:hypothetical protein